METYLLIAVAIGIAILIYYYRSTLHYQRRREHARRQALSQLGIDQWHQIMADKGFLFCGLFSLHDIESCAKQMNKHLFRIDYIRIAAKIKAEFNPEIGISNDVIRNAINNYCNQYQNRAANDQEYEF